MLLEKTVVYIIDRTIHVRLEIPDLFFLLVFPRTHVFIILYTDDSY